MTVRWEDILEWTFQGARFEDHGLDLDNLRDLVAVRQLLIEVTKELWRQSNPDRQRLPANVEQKLQLKIFQIRSNCATIPVRYPIEQPDQPSLPAVDTADPEDIRTHVPEAARVIAKAVKSAHRRQPLPSELTSDVLPLFQNVTASLAYDESVSIATPGQRPVRLTSDVQEYIAAHARAPWKDHTKVEGRVVSASLRGHATILDDQERQFEIRFDPNRNDFVQIFTQALHEHSNSAVHVEGWGMFSPPRGKLQHIESVSHVDIRPWEATAYADDEPPIWDALAQLSSEIPEERWEQVPTDLSVRHDKYVYDK